MAYQWDAQRGHYLDDGQPVPLATVRAGVRQVLSDSRDRLAILAERYRDNRLDTLGWRMAVRAELKTSYGVAASLAQGGNAQMDASARGFLSGQLRQAYAYLDVFALDVSGGRVDKASDAFLARARLYAGGVHTTFESFQRRGAARRGATEERNLLEPGANCDGCLGETGRGWVPIGTLSPPGSRDCVSSCRCELETR